MRLSTILMALSFATLAALGSGSRSAAGQEDPRIGGLLPHDPVVVDPNILADPKTIKTPGRAVPARPASAATPATSVAPESAPASGPTSGPETGPAGTHSAVPFVKPDFSTPKNALKSLLLAVASSNRADMKASFAAPANDDERALLDAGWNDDLAAMPVFLAAKEKFPNEVGKSVPDIGSAIGMFMSQVDGCVEKIDGDTAILKKPDAPAPAPGSPMVIETGGPLSKPVKFVKVGNDWKLAVEDGGILRKKPANEQAVARAMDDVYSAIAADIRAGKYPSFADVEKDIEQKHGEMLKKNPPAPGAN